jgi:hypothetical protein
MALWPNSEADDNDPHLAGGAWFFASLYDGSSLTLWGFYGGDPEKRLNGYKRVDE